MVAVRTGLFVAGVLLMAAATQAITITGYTTTANDRFTSGFPTTPVQNANPAFVGDGMDWSGVAWSTTTYYAGNYKGLAMLSPMHFLTAQHYEYANLNETTLGVRVLGQDNLVYSQTNNTITNLGYGLVVTNGGHTNPDLAVGTLTGDVTAADNLARLAVFDDNPSSSTDNLNNYNGLTVLLSGRSPSSTTGSPRVGQTTISSVGYNGGDPTQAYFATTQAGAIALQVGDSGYPAMYGWTNPNGGDELTVLGVNTATGSGLNYISFLGVAGAMNAANDVLAPDGYALRVVGDRYATWAGLFTNNINSNSNWGLGGVNNATSDQYVAFDASAPVNTTINVNTNYNLRGIYFLATASASDGFTLSGANTLTIGRGGVTNYDNSRQVFSANLALGDHQYWNVGAGGVTTGAIATNGHLLEIAGEATAIIDGVVSGAGGLALSGSRLELNAASTYTGKTWVHTGVLNVAGSIAASDSVILSDNTRLEGVGTVSNITGAGSVDPGNSPGILTANTVDPTGGLDFNFEFTQTGSPDYANASASGNDVLHLTNSTPFTAALDAGNVVSVYFNVGSLNFGDIFRGGFYIDENTDLLALIENAAFDVYLADGGGSYLYNGVTYSLYTGPYAIDLTAVSDPANFASGAVSGIVTQWTIIPEPASLVLLSLSMVVVLRRRR